MKIEDLYDDKRQKEKSIGKNSPVKKTDARELIACDGTKHAVIDGALLSGYESVTFAIKPRKTADEVKREFKEKLAKNYNIDQDFVAKIDDATVSLRFFEVFYMRVNSYNTYHEKEHSVYRDTGKVRVETTVDSNGKATSTVSPVREVAYTYHTTDSVTHKSKSCVYTSSPFFYKDNLDANKKAYSSSCDFFKIFNATKDDIFLGEEISSLPVIRFDNLQATKTDDYAMRCLNTTFSKTDDCKVIDAEIMQVLLFPIWEIEVNYRGKTYTSFFSDEKSHTFSCFSAVRAPIYKPTKGQNALGGLTSASTVIATIFTLAYLVMLFTVKWPFHLVLLGTIFLFFFSIPFFKPIGSWGNTPVAKSISLGENYKKLILPTIISFIFTIVLFVGVIVLIALLGGF